MSVNKIEEHIDPSTGQVYADSRTGDLIELIYIDGNVYLMQNEDGSHRMGKRKDFDRNATEGRYSLKPDEPQFAETGTLDGKSAGTEIPFEDLDNIGEKAAANLRSSGYRTCQDIRQADDDDILDVSWVGQSGLESIQEWCNE